MYVQRKGRVPVDRPPALRLKALLPEPCSLGRSYNHDRRNTLVRGERGRSKGP